MLKKSITYVTFDGVEVTEDFYFNLTTPEVTRIQAKLGDDIDKHAKHLAMSNDLDGMLDFIEIMVLDSYGVKSQDGKRFMKSPEIRAEFEYSAAYAELFEELLLNPKEAQAFGEGLAKGQGNTKKKEDMIAAYKAKQAQKEEE